MPRRPRPHAIAASAVAAALVLPLIACGAPAPSRSDPADGPTTHRLALTQEDAEAGSVTIVPERRNGALVVYLHGWGQDRRALLDGPRESPVARALVAAGFTMVGADAHLKAWGDPESLADYRRLIASAVQRYGLHDVFLMGESMGGLATMQLAGAVPGVRAVTAWYPVCDLRTMTAARFRASIDRAWRGLDRAAVSPVAVSGTPMLIWASEEDTVVAAGRNAAVCADRARARGGTVRWIRTTGQHGDPSNFDPGTVVRFFQSHRTPAPGPGPAVSGSL